MHLGNCAGLALILAPLLAPYSIQTVRAASWTANGPMPTARQVHTATLLPDGQVLVAGVFPNANLSLPLANWTPLSGVLEIVPGQFQLTDSLAANGGLRYYRLFAP